MFGIFVVCLLLLYCCCCCNPFALPQASPISLTFEVKDFPSKVRTAVLTLSVTKNQGTNRAPIITKSLPEMTAFEGQSFASANLRDFFADPENEGLTFSVNGLLSSSGLKVTPSGVITGVPNRDDVTASQPFGTTLTVIFLFIFVGWFCYVSWITFVVELMNSGCLIIPITSKKKT